ncbi:MAG TPA: sulfate/thiosulfate ABC transporter permease CysW, partial [Paenibacillaceae bacterium]|nr:sulfate/thiosulfate ABC transporter permease CysW [Paenibacillaceae bacterium]
MNKSILIRSLLIAITILFLTLFLILPLFTVFYEAFKRGTDVYFAAITDPETFSAIRLTLVTTAIVLPLNLAFGLCAAWAITRYRFRGKNIFITLIDLPFAVSPVISGLIFILLLGAGGLMEPLFQKWDIQIIYALPGIVLATLFVTFPYIPRELIPALQQSGEDEELAAQTLG